MSVHFRSNIKIMILEEILCKRLWSYWRYTSHVRNIFSRTGKLKFQLDFIWVNMFYMYKISTIFASNFPFLLDNSEINRACYTLFTFQFWASCIWSPSNNMKSRQQQKLFVIWNKCQRTPVLIIIRNLIPSAFWLRIQE